MGPHKRWHPRIFVFRIYLGPKMLMNLCFTIGKSSFYYNHIFVYNNWCDYDKINFDIESRISWDVSLVLHSTGGANESWSLFLYCAFVTFTLKNYLLIWKLQKYLFITHHSWNAEEIIILARFVCIQRMVTKHAEMHFPPGQQSTSQWSMKSKFNARVGINCRQFTTYVKSGKRH